MKVVAIYLLCFCLISLQGGDIDAASCTNGFPTRLINGRTSPTVPSNTVTRLIPEMNFTCNASIVGFTVAGRGLNTSPRSQIQIWHKNSSQNSNIYYQSGNSISVHVPYSADSGDVCMAARRIVGDTFWCILHYGLQITVQPGDILGLLLPATDTYDNEIFFTNGGPVNHVFEHQADQLGSIVNLSDTNRSYSIVQQLPQITFNLTSGCCLSGFPDTAAYEDGSTGRGLLNIVTTRLFPDLKFGCFGTIVGVIVTVADHNKRQNPKIQIWRENKTQLGLYHKIGSDLPLNRSDPGPPCYQHTYNNRILKCILNESHRISVQPGDFLGLEIPPRNKDDLVIYFKGGGPINLVFQHPLSSMHMVNRFTDPHCVTRDEPQITFLVVLDDESVEGTDSYSDDMSTTTPLPTATTTHVDILPTSTITVTTANIDYTIESETFGFSPAMANTGCTTTAGVIGGIIAILLLMVIILLVAVLIQRRHRKQYTVVSNGHTKHIANPVYDGASYNRTLPTQECQASYKDDTPSNYDHIKFNVKKEAVSLHTDDQSFNTTYEMLETQHYEMTGPALATHEEAYTYWEPANSVNDLHKQLSSNKYRELLRQQVKVTKALGSGQFGVVSLGVWQSPTGAIEVAVKQLQSGVTEAEKIRFLQEAAINGQFRHPNVVQLMGVVTTGEPAMIVLELLSNGDLRNFLTKHQTSQKLESGGVDKCLLLQFCQHIASGMSYLASKAFIHRDLAARNILVSKDRTCKISDFGMSRDLLDEDYYVSHGGMIPVKWTAPEAIHYKKYSTASDVWSFGCVVYEIWSLGHKPFESYNNPEVIKMIDKGYRLPPPPGLSKEFYKIMIQCWQPEHSHRPTFPQLVELLSRADFELFLWEEEDLRNSDPRVKEIGAPLEIALGLYPELQRTYLGKQKNFL